VLECAAVPASPTSPSGQRRAAAAALRGFGLGAVALTALRGLSRRAVFRVETEPGGGATRYVLRGYPPDVADATPIRSVLTWQEALVRDAGLGVPDPRRAPDGDLLVVTGADGEPGAGARYWSLVRWLDGRPLNRPYGEARLERVGAFVARLHQHAARWEPPAGFRLDGADAGDAALAWVRGGGSALAPWAALPAHERALVPVPDRERLVRLEQRLRALLTGAPAGRDAVGIVHGDLHPLNLLFRGRDVGAIDFDGTAVDFFANDLAVALGEGAAGSPLRAAFAAKRDALLRGYASVRPPPPAELLEALLTLKRLRSLPQLARWTGHARAGIAHWARAQVGERLTLLRSAPPGPYE
jgi:Ser/Thr protein kinase RdoA (MazF antagonist)